MDKAVTILMIDDDELDIRAFKRSLRRRQLQNPLRTASNGVEALALLRGEDGHEPIERPFTILLDINMPRMNGLEFLAELRSDPDLKDAVVFMLTTSDDDKDMKAAYDKQVAGYILKSRAGLNYAGVLDMLEPYWRVVEL